MRRRTPEVVVYTRQGCHLCTDAIATVRRVCAELGVAMHTVDIDTDPDLQARYTTLVPVTVIDGREHDHWRVDEERLRAALGRRPAR
ncbi:glutaredoxin family protein [Granulicoccus phenolivorans]|uniref:glutaredoxin family protein n=1 Tax=Granulicoccus phenolivorans TaxID=266854 RepID=UPI000426F714|nr:glutaredoxin family protein [Granulicoccus phenolivorans]